MGVVLKAFDPALHRIVAIKVLAPQLASSGTGRKRFIREAQAAAAIRDQHVVDIHAVGEEKGLPFIVMEFISGISLQEKIERSAPLPIDEALRIGAQTAAGLAAAHAQGLIHRDIKPANILLENGVERVKITDFGLARVVDDSSLTQSGVIAGTPQYMAPEQARGDAIDHRADLFSLGSVLYAMCTGEPPFRAAGNMATLKRVCDDTPRPMKQSNPDVPDWFVAVIAKLHAKNPAERFQTAREVGEVLARFLAHLQGPTQAPLPMLAPAPVRRPQPARRRRWVLAAGFALLVFGAMAALPFILEWGRGKNGGVANGPAPPGQDTLQVRLRATLEGHASAGYVAFHPADNILASAGAHGDHTIKLWDLTTEKELVTLPGHTAQITVLAFTVDGTTLASASLDRSVRFWDVDARKEREPALLHPNMVWALAFSPDGKTFATAGSDFIAKLWDMKTGIEEATLPTGVGARALAFAPKTKLLAVTMGSVNDPKVQLWNLETRQVQPPLLVGHSRGPECVAFDPDGALLATGGHDRTVILWDVAAGKKLKTLYHDNLVQGVAFSADGKILASCDGLYNRPEEPGAVKLWDVATRKELLTLPPHPGCVYGVAFSPRDNILATACADGHIRLWDVSRANAK
jgi:hypothetical protein